MARIMFSALMAYLPGSIPSGVWLSRRLWRCDIRGLGDGNCGARNVRIYWVGKPESGLGGLGVLFNQEMLPVIVLFALLYLIIRHFNLSASLSLGILAFMVWRSGQPLIFSVYIILVFISLPGKKLLDVRYRIPY